MLIAKNIFLWALRIISALILLQTLYFKFSASKESVYIFTAVGMEPWGRIGIGVLEFVTAILLLIPKYNWLGASLGIGLMAGALFFHLTKLGLVVMNDGGQLFAYALIVMISCIIILFFNKDRLFNFIYSTGILNPNKN